MWAPDTVDNEGGRGQLLQELAGGWESGAAENLIGGRGITAKADEEAWLGFCPLNSHSKGPAPHDRAPTTHSQYSLLFHVPPPPHSDGTDQAFGTSHSKFSMRVGS